MPFSNSISTSFTLAVGTALILEATLGTEVGWAIAPYSAAIKLAP
jgi:hypothetical protein